MPSNKAVVIGAGFGGIAAAIRLQAQGFEVTLLDRRDRPGGRAYVYEDKGFTFDAGPTVITAPLVIDELFECAGKDPQDYVELMPVHPLYRLYWEDGTQFDYTADLPSTLSQIERLAPQDVHGYQQFLKYTDDVFDAGYTRLAHEPFLNWGSMVKVSPQLLRLKAYRSVYSMVSRYIENPKLRQAFSFHSLLVGGNPFDTSSIYTLIHSLERKWGVYFARGGTGALIAGLVRLFTDIGGKVVLDADVDRIIVRQGKVAGVQTSGADHFLADCVVSNADVHHTYTHLLRGVRRVAMSRWFVNQARYSMSLFVLYFGTNRRYPQLAHHNILFGARYRELLADIFKRGVLANDFSLYLHAPTVTDPGLAPAGCEAFYVLSPVPHLGHSKTDWQKVAPQYADRILEYLEKRYLPGLRQSLVTQRAFTPLDFETELKAHHGSAFSLEPTLTQSAYFRVHNRDPHLKGLYFVGAGTHPGAGIPGVVNSAKATAKLIVSDYQQARRVYAAGAVAVSSAQRADTQLAATLTRCREMIRVGSRSFAFAKRLFRPAVADAASFLYGWCRYCDDQIDETMNLRLQQVRVARLKEQTLAALEGQAQDNHVFIALEHVVRTYQIPRSYPLELIEGMQMDIAKERYWTKQELDLYAYRVAGVVGLMLTHVMGVSSKAALQCAAHLGMAMQYTNIARDVLEDAARNRVYVPLQWLEQAGVPAGQEANPQYRAGVAQAVARLLREADAYYASGLCGLRYLTPRCALAVALAACVYRDIGSQVLRRGPRAWDSRTVVPTWKKVWLLLPALGLVARTLPWRLKNRFKAVTLDTVWRVA